MSLKPAVQELAELYAARRSAVEIVLNSGASGVLLQQARRGAPVDVFLSASPLEIDRLERERLVGAGARRTFASNRLVTVVPRGRTAPRRLADLVGTGYDLIAVGNPRTAPLGRYTREALEASGLWGRLQSRIVLAEGARQVLDYVARGEVSAAVVYRSDALLLGDGVVIGSELPADTHSPILYQGVRLRAASHPDLADDFLSFLGSESGARVLTRRGFSAPPG